MKIIGFSIKKVVAERKNPSKGKLEIKQGLNIENIAIEEINISDKPSLKFDFNFSIDYNPDIAKVAIEGSVIVLDDKGEGKEILKDWKKKKFDHPIKVALFNFILDKCNIRALHLEEEVGLPFHLPFPKLQVAPAKPAENPKSEKNQANYTG